MNKKILTLCTCGVVFLFSLSTSLLAQTNGAALKEKIAALDTQLFHAYNTCDLQTLGQLVDDNLEFYHDKTGLALGKAVFLESIQKYICGKVQRDLVPNTLEVHDLNNYGALEIGVHRFRHPDSHDKDVLGEAKFIMLWQNRNGIWKLTRVISYDHALAK